MMGLFGEKAIEGNVFYLLKPVGVFCAGDSCIIDLFESELRISKSFVKQKVVLKYNQITDIYNGWQSELTTQTGSPIGRAFLGGLLFGNAGATVGAISGTNQKQVWDKKDILIISYTAADGREEYLCFQNFLIQGNKVIKKLRELTGIAAPDKTKDIIL